MTKHHKTAAYISICFFLLFSSCKEDKDISVYVASKKDFENIVTVEGLVEPVKSTNIVSPRRGGQGTISFLIEDGVYVKEGDTICIIENLNLQNTYDQQVTRLESSMAGLEKTKADLSMQYALLDAQVKNNEAAAQIARLDSLQLEFYSPNQKKIREFELKQVEIEREKFKKKLDALSIIQNSELRKRELEIQRIANRVKSTKDELDGLVLRSPKRGLAVRNTSPLTDTKFAVGDNVWGNMVIVSIPEMDQMKVKLQASETDYRYININDAVTFHFDALPGSIGFGKIINKMPVGKGLTKTSKVKFFEIEASIDSTDVIPDPGFTARCHITLKQVKDTIVIPQVAVYEQDSMKVVYIKGNKGFQMRQVEMAETSAKEAVISRGIHAGETVALRKPAESDVTDKVKLAVIPDSLKTKQ